MKTDAQLLADVRDELAWDATVDDSDVVVDVEDGVVTLAGHVKSYADKWNAEKAAKKVAGVRALANELDIKLDTAAQRPDKALALAVANALESCVAVPASDIKVVVSDGWVTMEGKVAHWQQKNAAENVIRNLWGIKGISNNLDLKPVIQQSDIKQKIEQTFQRHAAVDAEHVHVNIVDSTVTLSGEVSSWHEREDAETAAWAAPGVVRVKNELAVRP